MTKKHKKSPSDEGLVLRFCRGSVYIFAAAAGTKVIAGNFSPGARIFGVKLGTRILERFVLFVAFIIVRRTRTTDQTFRRFVNLLHILRAVFLNHQRVKGIGLDYRAADEERNLSRRLSSMTENILNASFLYSFSGSF